MRGEIAKQYFMDGCNCAQAVVMAFADKIDAPKETLLAAAKPLGGGLGRLRETCGAVSGGAVALGLLFPDMDKSRMYALVQELALAFREKNGSYNCGELLTGAGVRAERSPGAEARTAAYYKKRPCADLVYDAAELVERILKEHGAL